MVQETSTLQHSGSEDAPPGIEQSASHQEVQPVAEWGKIWENLVRIGLAESFMRVGTGAVLVVLILVVVWVMSNFYLKGEHGLNTQSGQSVVAAPLPEATTALEPPDLLIPDNGNYMNGIPRLALLYTILPDKPRNEIVEYIVQPGDTIFGIAMQFNIKPETILWGNYYTLADDPHRISPGQSLNIMPVDGVLYEWHAGDGLNGVATFYGVTADEIIDWPGNNLNPDTIGDLSEPNIAPGTPLIIPGGRREFVSWSAPRITRSDPAVAKIFGPGACDATYDGPIGTGTFIWPSIEKWISGYDYSPETNHYGIDIAGKTGFAIFAVDAGVVVYAGWNDWGYGNVVVIDHGNGWQSLYAHLSSYNVGCGSYVYQGDIIGGLGSTGNSSGPHLHFELRSDQYGRPNPMNFLAR